jgi:hypothetical protein
MQVGHGGWNKPVLTVPPAALERGSIGRGDLLPRERSQLRCGAERWDDAVVAIREDF